MRPSLLNGETPTRPARLWGEGESRAALLRDLLAAHDLEARRRPEAAKWREALRIAWRRLRGRHAARH